MKVVDGLTLMMSEACNMRCKYCFEQQNGYKNKHMTPATVRKSLEIALSKENKSKELIISLFGGEPTVNKQGCREVIKTMKETDFSHIPSVYLSITSNMYKLDEEFVKGLDSLVKEKGIIVEYTVSCVLNEYWHNHDRVNIKGEGTYKEIIGNLEYCLQNYKNIKWKTHTVISKEMCKDFTRITDDTLDFKRKYPQMFMQSFNFVSSDSDENSTFDVYTKEEIKYVYEDYIKRDKTEFCETVYQDLYFPIIPSIEYLGKREISVCRALKTEVMVMTDGTIYPCHKIAGESEEIKKTFDLGNINNINSIYDITDKQDEFPNIKDGQVHFKSKVDDYDCTECNFNGVCHSCILAIYTPEDQFKYKSKKECQRTMQLAELNLEYEKLRIFNDMVKKMNELSIKIENLNNTSILQTEVMIQLLQRIENELNDNLKEEKEKEA